MTVILAGQSQATTFGMSRQTLPADWSPDRNAFIWVWDDAQQAGRWEQYDPAVNSAPKGYWGPELQLVREFRRNHPRVPIMILKYAPGQTGVAFDTQRNDWNLRSRGEAWDRLVRMTNSALDECDLEVDAIFWIGNHNDGLSQDHAELVGQNMEDLIIDSRKRWGPKIPWVIGLPDDTIPYFSTVRARLIDIQRSASSVRTFDTRSYGTQADGIHYDAAAVIALGRAFYTVWSTPP